MRGMELYFLVYLNMSLVYNKVLLYEYVDKKCISSAILTTTLISQIKQLHQLFSSIGIQMGTYKYIISNLVVHWATNARNLVALSQNLVARYLQKENNTK